jgi:prolyl 4-hydroxylase
MQQITAELLQWISVQARAGHKPDAVLQAMRSSGWQDDVALLAIERAKRGSPCDSAAAATVPQPNVAYSPCVLRTTDREVQVLATMQLPCLTVFGGLLAREECDALMDLARDRLERSAIVDSWSGAEETHDFRTSQSMSFRCGENDVVRRVEMRIAELLNWPIDHGECLQILRYGPGEEYRPHHDYFDPSVPGSSAVLQRGGQRVGTLVMYLNAPSKGGATVFPDIGFQVTPIQGNAVFFSYDRPHPATRTLHGGAPVIEGEKWVATKWLRAGIFS